jgi:hypothetical protein
MAWSLTIHLLLKVKNPKPSIASDIINSKKNGCFWKLSNARLEEFGAIIHTSLPINYRAIPGYGRLLRRRLNPPYPAAFEQQKIHQLNIAGCMKDSSFYHCIVPHRGTFNPFPLFFI